MQRSANRRYLPRRPGAVYVFADRAAAERWGTTSGGDAGRDVVLNAVETAMSVHAAKRAIPNAIIAISDVSGTRSPSASVRNGSRRHGFLHSCWLQTRN